MLRTHQTTEETISEMYKRDTIFPGSRPNRNFKGLTLGKDPDVVLLEVPEIPARSSDRVNNRNKGPYNIRDKGANNDQDEGEKFPRTHRSTGQLRIPT